MAIIPIIANMTALEVARRSSDPNAFTITETMSMKNTMLHELPILEANDGAVHTSVQRLSYPRAERRLYNRGVGKTSSQTDTVRDIITMLEVYSDVDVALAEHSGNPAALYKSEALAVTVGMGLDQADSLIYDNHAQHPAEIYGLAARLAKCDDRHCVDFGGRTTTDGDLTSVFLVAGGPQSCHLIYPKGSKSVGVQRLDKGEIYVKDENDPTGKKEFLAHRDHFKAQYGIVIAHPDAVVRICNIPILLDQAGRKKLIELVLRFQKKLTVGIVNQALFCNGDMVFQIEQAARDIQLVIHPEADPWGKPVSNINGIRIRQQDAILSAEGETPRAA